jgi:hypothetical protein
MMDDEDDEDDNLFKILYRIVFFLIIFLLSYNIWIFYKGRRRHPWHDNIYLWKPIENVFLQIKNDDANQLKNKMILFYV